MSLSILSQTTKGPWFVAGCLAAATAFTSLSAAAQSAAPTTIRLQPEDLDRGQYGPQRNFYFLPPGKTREEDYLSAGFFGQKLRPYLAKNREALDLLDSYKRQKTLYLVDRAVLVGSVIGYAAQVFSSDDSNAQYAKPGQIVAGGLLVTSLVATLFINKHTNEYMLQAVDTYNTGRPEGYLRRLRPTHMGLGATPQGQPILALSWKL